MESSPDLKRVTLEKLKEIAKKDIPGWHAAFDLRVQDLIDVVLADKPKWEHKSELNKLIEAGTGRTDEQQARLGELILELTGLNQDRLEFEIL